MRDLMFASVWVALLPLCFLNAYVGVLVWVWVALLSPVDLVTGFMAGVPLNKIVALTTFLAVVISREKKDFYPGTTVVLLLTLTVSATISWLFGVVHTDADDQLYEKLVKEVVLALVITAVMTTRYRIHALVMVIVIALGFQGVKEGLISIFTAGGHKILGTRSMGDNNSEALALLMITTLALYLARNSAAKIVRTALYGTVALCLITVIMSFSRGGFIGLIVLGAFTIVDSKHKLSGLALVCVVAVLILTLAPESWYSRVDTLQTVDDDSSFMGRVVAWKMSWLLAMDRPFFGGGPHAIQHATVWAKYLPDFPRLNFIHTPPATPSPLAAHSIYFEILGDLGFVGLALFLGLIASAIADCSAIIGRARDRPEFAWASDLARMTRISLVVYLVSGAALSMGYFELIYILVAMVSRVRRLVPRETVAQARAAELAEARVAVLTEPGVPSWATST